MEQFSADSAKNELKIRERARAATIVINPEGKILFLTKTSRKMGQKFLELPGGGIQPGETPGRAAQRELAEEGSLKVAMNKIYSYNPIIHISRVKEGGNLAKNKDKTKTKVKTTYFVVEIEDDYSKKAKPGEKKYTNCTWLTIDEMKTDYKQHKFDMRLNEWRVLCELFRE